MLFFPTLYVDFSNFDMYYIDGERFCMERKVNDRVKEARNKLHISQNYVAEYLGVNRNAVIDIESGKRKISAEELQKYSKLFGITADELLNGRKTSEANIVFARQFETLDEKDQEEILNLIEFKRMLKENKKRN